MNFIASISYSYYKLEKPRYTAVCPGTKNTCYPFRVSDLTSMLRKPYPSIISFTLSPISCHITSLVDVELLKKLFVQIR
jgi:hypothetical protein